LSSKPRAKYSSFFDNGLVTFATEGPNAKAWEITNPVMMREDPSPTFHGRDVFAPSAAAVASGAVTPEDAGAPVASWVGLDHTLPKLVDGAWLAEVQLLDKAYGNVWSTSPEPSSPQAGSRGASSSEPGNTSGPSHSSRRSVTYPKGRPWPTSIARSTVVCDQHGNFAATHGLRAGMPIVVEPKR
jgi:hypothetical protein